MTRRHFDIRFALTEHGDGYLADWFFALTEHEDGYRIADWFTGGWEALDTAAAASSAEVADRILRDAYKGPDVDGVEVRWTIA